mmetsp:Transcript_26022/g.102267  ORF Transcript_26022/g.102267 Transcript_26022/m.102267 type:complete len:231 (-) Transcript_26022:327-1019(-)
MRNTKHISSRSSTPSYCPVRRWSDASMDSSSRCARTITRYAFSKTQTTVTRRQQKYVNLLLPYSFEILHIRGTNVPGTLRMGLSGPMPYMEHLSFSHRQNGTWETRFPVRISRWAAVRGAHGPSADCQYDHVELLLICAVSFFSVALNARESYATASSCSPEVWKRIAPTPCHLHRLEHLSFSHRPKRGRGETRFAAKSPSNRGKVANVVLLMPSPTLGPHRLVRTAANP